MIFFLIRNNQKRLIRTDKPLHKAVTVLCTSSKDTYFQQSLVKISLGLWAWILFITVKIICLKAGNYHRNEIYNYDHHIEYSQNCQT